MRTSQGFRVKTAILRAARIPGFLGLQIFRDFQGFHLFLGLHSTLCIKVELFEKDISIPPDIKEVQSKVSISN